MQLCFIRFGCLITRTVTFPAPTHCLNKCNSTPQSTKAISTHQPASTRSNALFCSVLPDSHKQPRLFHRKSPEDVATEFSTPSDAQEFPNPKIYFRVCNRLTLVPILSQTNPSSTLVSCAHCRLCSSGSPDETLSRTSL
jgi:hypothetical protein